MQTQPNIRQKPPPTKRDILADHVDGDLLCADGFDDAIIGTVYPFSGEPLALYDRDRCIEILVEEGMSHEDAEEHFQFNVEGAYVGPRTPLYAVLLKHYEEF